MSKRFFTIYEKYMSVMGIASNLMFYIQAYKIYLTGDAKSISILAFFLSGMGAASWLVYGILLKNIPLIVANLVGLIGASLVLVSTMIYNA